MTHYIPKFTTRRDGYELTACGVFIPQGTGVTEAPGCPTCQVYLDPALVPARRPA